MRIRGGRKNYTFVRFFQIRVKIETLAVECCKQSINPADLKLQLLIIPDLKKKQNQPNKIQRKDLKHSSWLKNIQKSTF